MTRAISLTLAVAAVASAAIYSPVYPPLRWFVTAPEIFYYGGRAFRLEVHPELDSLSGHDEQKPFDVAVTGRMQSIRVYARDPREAAKLAVEYEFWENPDVRVLAVFEVIKLRCPPSTWEQP